MNNYSEAPIDKIQERFKIFAEQECKGSSEVYFYLSNKISEDEYLSKLASFTKMGQPFPNSFLSAVHFLLLKNRNCELAKYYPSITKDKTYNEIPFELFKNFCQENEQKIKDLISTNLVQTNVIGRCSYLFPIVSELSNSENKPTTIIDIGTSAGLTLNFDLYEYWYNEQKLFGDSTVKNQCKLVDCEPKLINSITNKLTKIGIDQNLINPKNDDEKLWLNSLIWADHLDRFIAMEEALKLEELNQIEFIEASKVSEFEEIISRVPKEDCLIIYSTHTLYQFNSDDKKEFSDMLNRIGEQRDFYFISAETTKDLLTKYDTKNTVVELTTFKNKTKTEKIIAETNGHGNWITWKN